MKIIQSSFLRNSFLGSLFLIGLTGIEVKAHHHMNQEGWPSAFHCNACWDSYDTNGSYCRPTDTKRWLKNQGFGQAMGWKTASLEKQIEYCNKCGMKHDRGTFNNYCERK